MSLRIVIVGPWPPYRGGIAQFGARLGSALVERGHEVRPLTYSRQYPSMLFPGSSQFEPAGERNGAPVAPKLIDSLSPRSWFQAGRYVRELEPDVVVFQHWMPFFGPSHGFVARRVGDVPRIALVHNALPHERRPGDVALTRYFFKACDAAIALSASVEQDINRVCTSLPVRRVAHPPYDRFGKPVDRATARLKLGLPEDAPVLLFFGFIRRYKGLDVLLDAMALVRDRHPRARLVVAGEFYDDEAMYREQIRRQRLEDVVLLESRYIADEEIPIFFSAADVVVQPYRTATQSGVAGTAAGFGVPVITTDVGGLAEVVPHGEAGLIVPPDDAVALAESISTFINDPELADKLRRGAMRQAGSTWEDLCQTIEDLVTYSL